MHLQLVEWLHKFRLRGDEKANEEAFAKVRADKEREARDGHDGTWVAHPGLSTVALEVFNREMPEPIKFIQESNRSFK